ncbi:MAG: DUF5719 family protein, partial [Actinomycetota bacterium]
MSENSSRLPLSIKAVAILVIIALAATFIPLAAVRAWAQARAQAPRGMSTSTYRTNLYFAEGSTRPGFTEYLTLLNPSGEEAEVEVIYLLADKQGFARTYSVAPSARRTLNVNDELASPEDVSLVVRSNSAIMAERPLYFDHGPYRDGSLAVGQRPPSTTYFFAEGTTRDGFEEWLCLANPSPDTAKAMVQFVTSKGERKERPLEVKPWSRTTLKASDVVGPGQDVACQVASDLPLVAERAQYFDFEGYCGGHVSSGMPEPATSVAFAEGTTRPGYAEYLALFNPASEPADLEITYLFSGGDALVRHHSVLPLSRYTIEVAEEVGPDRDVSCFLNSSVPLVAERPLYFNTGTYTGGHVGVGANATNRSYLFAEGTTRPGFDEYLCIENADGRANHARIDFLPDGGGAITREVDLPARSRTTIPVCDTIGRGIDHGTIITAEKPVLVERPIYYDTGPCRGGDISGGVASHGPSRISIDPPSADLKTGESAAFRALVTDEEGHLLPATPSWTLEGGMGSIAPDGTLNAQRSGSGRVVASAWGLQEASPLTVKGPERTFAKSDKWAIDSPASGSITGGVVAVTGSASCNHFSRYELAWAPASNPGDLHVFAESSAEVDAGLLGEWDTTSLADGSYVLKLTVYRTHGAAKSDTNTVACDNTAPAASIQSPAQGALVAGSLTITGTASDPHMGRYTVASAHSPTGLLLHLDSDLTDAVSGTGPLESESVAFQAGRFASAASLSSGSTLSYSTEGRLAPDSGTVGMWINPAWDPETEDPRSLFSTSAPEGTSGNTLSLIKYPDSLTARIVDAEGEEKIVEYPLAEGDLAPGTWSHVALSWNDGDIHVFLNGHPATSPNSSGPGSGQLPALGDRLQIGRAQGLPGCSPMLVDEVAAYLGERSPEEVRSDFQATSPLAVAGYTVFSQVDSTSVTDGTLGVLDTSTFADGPCRIRLAATDTVGNTAGASRSVVCDNVAPVAVLDAPAEGETVSGQYRVGGTAYDASLSGFDLEFASASAPDTWQGIALGESAWVWQGELGTWDTRTLDSGQYTLRLTVRDESGRVSVATRQTNVENIPPEAQITSPVDDAVLFGTVDITGTATAGAFQDYSITARPAGLRFLARYDEDTSDALSGEPGELSGNATYEPTRFASGIKLAPGSTLSYPTEGRISPERGTIEMWFRPDEWTGIPGESHVLFYTEPAGAEGRNMLGIVSFNQPEAPFFMLMVSSESGGNPAMAMKMLDPDLISSGVPFHVAATWREGSFNIFINGQPPDMVVGDQITPDALGTRFFVGGAVMEGQDPQMAGGFIDELSIWDYAKTAGEIQEDCAATASYSDPVVQPPTATPVVDGTLSAWDTVGVPNGVYTLTLLVRDTSGRSAQATRTVRLDNDVPVAAIESPSDGAVLKGSVEVIGTALDSGINYFTLEYASTVDPENWFPISSDSGECRISGLLGTLDTSTLADGDYLVRLEVVDLAQRVSYDTIQVAVKNLSPTAQITAPASGTFVRGLMDVEGTATDSRFSYYSLRLIPRDLAFASHLDFDASDFRGGAPGQITGSGTFVPAKFAGGISLFPGELVRWSAEGRIDNNRGTFEAWVVPQDDWATDLWKRTMFSATTPDAQSLELSSEAGTLRFQATSTDGQKTCEMPVDPQAIQPSVPFHVAASWHAGELHLFMNGQAAQIINGTGSGIISSALGEFSLGPDNGQGEGRSFTMDEVALFSVARSQADIRRDSLAAGPRPDPVSQFYGTAVDGGLLGTIDTTALPDDEYDLTLAVSDIYGTTSQESVWVASDNMAPTAAIDSPAPDETVGGEVGVTGTASDRYFESYTLEWGSGAEPSSWNQIAQGTGEVISGLLGTWDASGLDDGPYTIRLRVSGGGIESNATRQVTLDSQPPEVGITYPTPEELLSGTVTVTGTATDSSLESYTLSYAPGVVPDAGDFASISSSTVPVVDGVLGSWDVSALADGVYTLLLEARDGAGRESRNRVYVGVNTQDPQAAISFPAEGQWLGDTVGMKGTATDEWFDNYTVTYAPGWTEHTPEDWIQIGETHDSPVAGPYGDLETWDTSALPMGDYTLRLQVEDLGGRLGTAEIHVRRASDELIVDIMSMQWQQEERTLQIRGTASGEGFYAYRVIYSLGDPPQGPWIDICERTYEPVEDGVLADWHTGGVVGPCTVKLIVEGPAGNATYDQQAVILDYEAPRVSLDPLGPVSATAQITGTATDANLDYYMVEYARQAPELEWHLVGSVHCTSVEEGVLETFDPVGLASGHYLLRLTAFDKFGYSASASIDCEVDCTAPIAQIVSPDGSSMLSGEVPISGSAYDDYSFDRYVLMYAPSGSENWHEIAVENQSVTSGQLAVWDTSAVPEGSYDLRLDAYDGFSNTSCHLISGLSVDNSQPAAIITSPDPSMLEVRGETVDIQGTANDDNFLSFTLSYAPSAAPDAWQPIGEAYTEPVESGLLGHWSTSALPDGVYNLRLIVHDRAGHLTIAYSFVEIDNHGPIVAIDSPAPLSHTSDTVTITGTAGEPHFSRYTLSVASGQDPGLDEFTVLSSRSEPVYDGELGAMDTRLYPDGPLTIKLEAEDVYDHETMTSTLVYLDNTAPQAAITDPEASQAVSGEVVIGGTAADDYLDNYVVQYAPGPYPADGTWIDVEPPRSEPVQDGILATWSTGGLAEGTYTLRVKTTDKSGNTSESRVTVTVTSVMSGTGLWIDEGAAYCRSTGVTLTVRNPGARYMQFSNNSGDWSAWEPYAPERTWELSEGDGRHTVYARVRDDQGRVTGLDREIHLDTTPPVNVQIDSPANQTPISGPVWVVASASDLADGSGLSYAVFKYSFSGSQLINFGGDNDPSNGIMDMLDPTQQGEGYYDLFARVYDRAGNCTLSPAVSVRYIGDSAAWPHPNHDSSNTRFDGTFSKSPYWYSQTWAAGTDYLSNKTPPIAGVGEIGGVPCRRIYHVMRGYNWMTHKNYAALVGFDADNGGQTFWIATEEPQVQFDAYPLSVQDGFLYAVAGTKICRFKVGDEAQQQTVFDAGGRITAAPCYLPGGMTVVPTTNALRGLMISGSSVEELWSIQISNPYTPAISEPNAAGDRYLAFTAGGCLYVYVLPAGGQPPEPWFHTASSARNIHGVPAISGNRLFVHEVGSITAFDLANRLETWSAHSETGNAYSVPAVAYNIVYAAYVQDTGYLDARDAITGNLLWRQKLEGMDPSPVNPVLVGAPTVGNGQVFIAAQKASGMADRVGTNLYTFDAFSGSESHPPFGYASTLQPWSSYGDPSVTLAFGALFIAWNSSGTVRLDTMAPETQNRGFDNYCSFHDEVNTSLGSVTLEEKDFQVPSLGFPLEFVRNYSSYKMDKAYSACAGQIPEDGPLGPGWSFNYGMRIDVETKTYEGTSYQVATLVDSDGSFYPFVASDTGWKAPRGVFDELISIPEGFQLTRKDHTRFTFETIQWEGRTTARLVSMCNDYTRAGTNTTTLSYRTDHPLWLEHVTEPDKDPLDMYQQRTITFEYFDAPEEDGPKFGKLKKVDFHGSFDWTFDYQYSGTDPNMYESSVTDPDGAITRYHYADTTDLDVKGIAWVQNQRGKVVDYTYETETSPASGDILYRVTSKSNPHEFTTDAPRTTFCYTTTNKTTVITDPAGGISVHRYDSSNRIVQEIDPLGRATNYQYGTDGLGKTTTAPGDKTTKYEMREIAGQPSGDLLRVTDAEGGQIEYTYTSDAPDAMVASVEDPNGNLTQLSYDDTDHPFDLHRKVEGGGVAAGGADTTYFYNENGKPCEVAEEMALGQYSRTMFVYDPYGNKTTESRWTDEDGGTWRGVVSLKYSVEGRVIEKTDAEGHVYTYTYSPTGLLLTEDGPEGYHVSYTYSPGSVPYGEGANLHSKTDAEGRTVTYYYDEADRLISTRYTYRDYGSDEEHVVTEEIVYDDCGNVIRRTDGNGHHTNYTYDRAGRLLTVTHPNGQVERYSYPDEDTVEKEVEGYGTEITLTDKMNRTVEKTNAEGEVTRYEFDPAGNKTAEIKNLEFGQEAITTYEYDALNRPVTKYEPAVGGEVPITRYYYNGVGQVKRTVDPHGYETTYTYDSQCRTKRMTINDGRSRTTTYQEYSNNGNLERVSDPNGNIKKVEYDYRGRPVTEMIAPPTPPDEEPAWAPLASYEYDGVGNRTKITLGDPESPEARVTITDYDELNRPVRVRNLIEGTTEYAQTITRYDNVGNVISSTDPNSNVTHYEYDEMNRPRSKSEPAPNGGACTTAYSYDDTARSRSLTTPAGARTLTFTDRLGRETYVYGPEGEERMTAYNKLGKPASVKTRWTEDEYSEVSIEYDALARPTSQTDALDRTTTFGYTMAENKSTITDPEGHTTVFYYDGLGKPTLKLEPYSGETAFATAYSYDLNGNLLSQAEGSPGEQRVTSFAYDERNRILAASAGPGVTTGFTYDSAGNLIHVTDPNGNHNLAISYDHAGRLKSKSDHAGNTYDYAYDLAGNLTETTDPLDSTVTRSYNPSNLVSRVGAEGTSYETFYNYDDDLNLTLARKPQSGQSLYMSYDRSKRLTNIESEVPAAPLCYSQNLDYDYRGNLTTLIDHHASGSSATSYSYDAAGQLANVSDSRGASWAFNYNPDGTLAHSSLPGGLATAYEYWDNNLVRSITTADLARFTYDYNSARLISGGHQEVQGNPASGQYLYSYDTSARLTSSESTAGLNRYYSYDPSGNRTSKTEGGQTTTYAYDQDNRLTADSSGASYGYDACGNLTSITGGTRQDTSYSYNELGQMTGSQVGSEETDYTYDPMGRMTDSSRGGSHTYLEMLLTTDEPLAVTDSGGTTGFIRAPGSSSALGTVTPEGDVLSLGTNAHSDVVFSADDQGNLASGSIYGPYGEKTSSGASSAPLGFGSDYTDAATGLVDTGDRLYDAELGRYNTASASAPAATDALSANPYLYAGDSPLATLSAPNAPANSKDWLAVKAQKPDTAELAERKKDQTLVWSGSKAEMSLSSLEARPAETFKPSVNASRNSIRFPTRSFRSLIYASIVHLVNMRKAHDNLEAQKAYYAPKPFEKKGGAAGDEDLEVFGEQVAVAGANQAMWSRAFENLRNEKAKPAGFMDLVKGIGRWIVNLGKAAYRAVKWIAKKVWEYKGAIIKFAFLGPTGTVLSKLNEYRQARREKGEEFLGSIGGAVVDLAKSLTRRSGDAEGEQQRDRDPTWSNERKNWILALNAMATVFSLLSVVGAPWAILFWGLSVVCTA